MKSFTFPGTLSTVERGLAAAAAVTMSLATTTVVATAFQGAAIADAPSMIAMLSKAFA